MSTTQFNPTVFMSRAFEKAAAQSATDFSIAVIHALADKYGFDAKEAMAICQISEIKVKKSANRVKGEGKVRATKAKAEPKPKREVPAFPLPFCGQAVENWCLGLRLNHGLHSQCTMERIAGGDYCKTCQKQCDKNASGKPTYGCVADRMACPILEYRDPKAHKQTLPFANVMTKLNITREAAEAEALKFGLTIPEEHFVERASRRGRPKKEKKVIAASVGDDLIASLVASAKKASTPTPSVTSNSEKNDDASSVVSSSSEKDDDASSVVSSLSSASAKSTSTKSKKLKVKKIKAPKVKTPEQIAKEEAKAKRAAEKEAKLATLSAQHQELLTKLGRPAEAAPQKIGELTKLVSALKKELKAVEKAKKEAEIKAKKDAEALAIKEKLEKEAALLKEKEAAAAAAMVAPAQEEENVEEDDDDSTNVVEFKHGGVTYWKDGEGNLYDPETQEQVGFWNKETQQVETIEEFGSDEDSSEDESED